MPGHQTLKFSYNFKAKRYNVNLVNKNQSEPKHLGCLSVIKNEEREHDEKVTLTPK